MNAVQAMKKVSEHAVAIKNNDPVIYTEFPVKGIHWQGDVGIIRLEELPNDCSVIKNHNLQLAPGTTKGSRHILSSVSGVTIYKKKDATVLEGPVLKCDKSTEITHPEHGNVTIPNGIYAIVYQRAYADELRRVED